MKSQRFLILIAMTILGIISQNQCFCDVSYFSIQPGSTIFNAQGEPLRDSLPGEVVKLVGGDGEKLEFVSAVKNLVGGFVNRAHTSPVTTEEYLAWRMNPVALTSQAVLSTERGRRLAVPSEKIAKWFEEERSAHPVPVVWSPSEGRDAPVSLEPLIGWFSLGQNTTVQGTCVQPDGKIIIIGTADQLSFKQNATFWNDCSPEEPGVYFARFSADFHEVEKILWVSTKNLGVPFSINCEHDGSLTFITSKITGDIYDGPLNAASSYFIKMEATWDRFASVFPLDATNRPPLSALNDPLRRPVLLYGSEGRHGGGSLLRLFTHGQAERPWKDWSEANKDIIKLDFSSPSFANGPFALWAKGAEITPDFPTPLAPWGSPPNSGEPLEWTNAKSGRNPIHGADLKPEAMVVDNGNNIFVAGTIPFEMPLPDFDPFLMKFSPEGKLLWTNCFLNGLLSEPDQKTQALQIDPSNGDILICFWQHGNNQKTLLLDPDGWLTKFTGTNGNIKITWIGRVDAESGTLKHSTYIYSQKPDQKNPRWPDLNSATVNAMQVAQTGRVYVAGATTISYPTTFNSFLPSVVEYGAHPMLTVLRPNLSAPHYSTYLSSGQGSVEHLTILSNGSALCIGTHSTQGIPLPIKNDKKIPFLNANPPKEKESVFLAIIPIPVAETEWSFNQKSHF